MSMKTKSLPVESITEPDGSSLLLDGQGAPVELSPWHVVFVYQLDGGCEIVMRTGHRVVSTLTVSQALNRLGLAE